MTELTRQLLKTRVDATSQQLLDLAKQNINKTAHVFIAIRFFSSGSPVTPSAGTYDITVQPEGMGNFIAVTGGAAIDATVAPSLLSFAANAQGLAYDPTGITGADEVEITVTGNYA